MISLTRAQVQNFWLTVLLIASGSPAASASQRHGSQGPVPETAVSGYPFPQHTAYVPGSIKPDNVTQQQMDDSVRTFYNRWKSRYLKHDCGAGQYYVFFDERPPSICVSEGQGYGMLITAIMAGYDPNARTYFDGLYNFYRAHPSSINNRLMAWNEVAGCLTDTVSGADAATDGDLDMAFGLLLADAQWGSDGAINYFQEANAFIAAIMKDEINQHTWSTKLGDWSTASDANYYYGTRTSDFMMDHFRIFQQASGDSNWLSVLDQCYSLIASMQTQFSPATGLLPDFIVHTSTSPAPAPPNYLEASTDGSYSYNACRDPWRIATDYLMSGDPRAKAALDKLNTWIRSQTGGDPTRIWSGYRLNGSNVAGNQYNAESFTGPFAVSAMVNPANQQWLNDLWTFNVSGYNFDSAFYYENTLKLLTMIVVSGNWWQPQLQRTIAFSGFQWDVKSSTNQVGPGPNYFSLSPDNVRVDSLGQLHLKITKRNGRWYCSEIMLDSSLGYGRYVFSLNSRVGQINDRAVFGLFTWDDAAAQSHREIDIEFSRWSDPMDTTDAQFVVQPYNLSGNLIRWTIPASVDSSTNGFNWRHDSISFLSVKGHHDFPPYQETFASWKYNGSSIPAPGNEKVHLNLWLDQGAAPSDSQEIEVVIQKFEFNPQPPSIRGVWRMVSLQRRVTDGSVRSLYPAAISPAYLYDPLAGYQRTDTLKERSGYWVKMAGDSAAPVSGDSILTDTIIVVGGWNLIGSISVPRPVSSILTIPPGLTTSRFFGYSSAYQTSDTIQPGSGYWVKSTSIGSLILSSAGPLSATGAAPINILAGSDSSTVIPPAPPGEERPAIQRAIPKDLAIAQNFPNPFNPTTSIQFTLPVEATVKLGIFNLLGQQVATLVDGIEPPGKKSVRWDPSNEYPSGVYFYRLESASTRNPSIMSSRVGKMLLLR